MSWFGADAVLDEGALSEDLVALLAGFDRFERRPRRERVEVELEPICWRAPVMPAASPVSIVWRAP